MDISLTEWLEQVKNNPFHVYVENSEVSSSGLIGKNVILYNICWVDSENKSGTSSRRYSEFETLWQILTNKYRDIGIVIPPLPPKRLVGHDAEFINTRKRGLTLFCQAIADNPFLRFDAFWMDFLKADCDLKEGMKQAENNDNLNNIGFLRLQQAMEAIELPVDLSRFISHLRTETTNLDRPLRQLLESSRALALATTSYTNGLNVFFEGVESVSDFETNEVIALNGLDEETKKVNAGSQSLPNLMSALARMLSVQCEVHRDFPIINSMLVSEVIEFEISRINELRTMIKYREDFVSNLAKSEKKLQQIEENQKSRQDQKDDQRKIVENQKNALHKFTKGLFLLTVPHIIDSRNRSMRMMVAHICAMQSTISNSILLASNNLFSSLEMPAYDAISNANKNMTDLLLPFLPDTNTIIESLTKTRENSEKTEEDLNTAEVRDRSSFGLVVGLSQQTNQKEEKN